MSAREARWWRQWRALASWERCLVLEFVLRMALLWLQLRLYSTGQLLKHIDVAIQQAQPRQIPAGCGRSDFVRRCDKLVVIAACHGFYRATCLPRSLALYRVLRGYGLPARLRLGVMPGSRPLQAHAWVECDSEVLCDVGGEYQPFAALDKAGGV